MKDQITNHDLDPTLLIIFGITGDLAKKKVLPALYHLFQNGSLPATFKVIGISRHDVAIGSILDGLRSSMADMNEVYEPSILSKLEQNLEMVQMDLAAPKDYESLLIILNQIETEFHVHMNRLYYLSLPPEMFEPVVNLLGQTGHNASCQHSAASTRLLIEKPFGCDVASAQTLIQEISTVYSDFQQYRIDHYLAKETVQNILTFRFNNPVFEASWDHHSISYIKISAVEKLDIQGRVIFYEQTGAVRDLIQSHLLQLLALITMERPVTMLSKDIHAAKLQLMQAIEPVVLDDVVLGQYQGYRDEVNNQDSNIETYAAIKLKISTPAWQDVPIYLETGKALDQKSTTITVVFKSKFEGQPTNQLTFHLQPHEGITLCLYAKQPGLNYVVDKVPMSFSYNNSFKNINLNAYERVLIDAIRGDKTLFSTSDEVLAAWKIVEPIMKRISQSPFLYEPGSKGPVEAQKLLPNIEISK